MFDQPMQTVEANHVGLGLLQPAKSRTDGFANVFLSCRCAGKRGPEAVTHLIAEGLSAENPALRVEAAKMLGRIRDRAAGVPMVHLLKDSDPQVREAAAETIGYVGDPPALHALVRLLEDEATRDVAADVLGRLKDPAVMEPLAAMMTSADSTARRLAAEALEQLADPRSVDAWIAAMAYPDLLDIASRSLKRIGPTSC